MLLVPIVAALVGGSLAMGLLVQRAVGQDMIASVDDELARVQVIDGDSRRRGEIPEFAGQPVPVDRPIVGVLETDGTLSTGDPVALDASDVAHLAVTRQVATVGEDPRYRVMSRPRRDGTTVLVGLSLARVDHSLASLARNLLVGGVVLVGVQTLVVLWVAERVSWPLTRLSAATHEVSEGDLDADLGPPAGSRETAQLNADLRTMIERLRATIGRSDLAATEAVAARADMEQFMADAAHELRTPLTALRGYSDLYADGMLDEDGLDRAMGRIGSESARLASMVIDLLDLAQPVHEEQWEPVDLAAVASAVAYDVRAAHPDHHVVADVDSSGSCVTVGNAARLHQAVLNLVANAAQHTPAGSTVSVSSAVEAESVVVVRVADDGPGVDPSIAESLFVPFARGDESRSRQSHDGAGLGLALVRRIAEQHNGSVKLTPTLSGACFELRLPLAPGPPSQ